MAFLLGCITRRGIGITRTVSCKMQAMWGENFGSVPPSEIPNPYPVSIPGVRLSTRQGIYIKYFNFNHSTAGTFYLIERSVGIGTTQQPTQRGYPLVRPPGTERRRQKRLKQVFLPMTGSIRIFSSAASVEPGSTLEYG